MAGVESYSEFDGNGVMPNTVFPKGSEALNAHDKLRLQSLTGQETDSRAPVDPYFWTGGAAPDESIAKAARAERTRRSREIVRDEINRYKESR